MKTIIYSIVLLGSVFCTSQLKGQVVLKAIDPVFTSIRSSTRSGSVCRNNCPPNHYAGCVTYTVTSSGNGTSYNSQTEADFFANQAAEQNANSNFEANKQSYANNHASCTPYTYTCTVTHSGNFNLNPGESLTILNPDCFLGQWSYVATTYQSSSDESKTEVILNAQCCEINNPELGIITVCEDITITTKCILNPN